MPEQSMIVIEMSVKAVALATFTHAFTNAQPDAGSHAPGRKDIVAEIEAVTSLLRAQHDDRRPAAGARDG